MSMLAVLIFPLTVLLFAAVSVVSPSFGTSSITNPGPHGLTQILYAFVSAAGNNGSAFGGLGANTPWYNAALGFAMLAGRFLFIVPMLAVAGNLAGKKRVPPSPDLSRDDAAVRRAAGQRGADRRRADVLPGAQPGSDPGTPDDGPGSYVLRDRNVAATHSSSIWDRRIVRGALVDAVRKLNPRRMVRNPVMFVVEAGSVLTTIQLIRDAVVGAGRLGFELHITLWLWATVLANLAE
jgi:hypothetical protein